MENTLQIVKSYVALDLETTGLNAKNDRIIEIGAVKFIDGKRTEVFSSFVNPRMDIPARITEITGIKQSDVEGFPYIENLLPKLIEFIGDLPILGHNIAFDYKFLKHNAVNLKLDFEPLGIDTLLIARKVLTMPEKKNLESLCSYFDIAEEPRHRAFSDAAAAARLYEKLSESSLAAENIEEFVAKPFFYSIKKESPITPKQLELLKKLTRMHNINLGIELESLTKNQASRHIDLIFLEYGR